MDKPNDFIHAKLSNVVYDNHNPTKGKEYNDLSEGWECLATSGEKDNHEGYFGAAFRKGNDVIIAHRGTHNNSITKYFKY